MKRRKFLSTLLSIAAMMFLSVLATTQAQAQNTFSGRARGIVADVFVNGVAQANVTVSDTGQLPASGGNIVSPPLVSALVLAGVGTVNASAVNTRTSGGAPAGNPATSQSQASVTNLNATILGIPITATLVQSNSMCQCSNTGVPSCTGNVTITNLMIGGVAINVANTTVVNLTTVGGAVVGQVFINEQTVTGTGQMRMITVNALRISLNAPGVTGTNIIIAQAQSDITCAVIGNQTGTIRVRKDVCAVQPSPGATSCGNGNSSNALDGQTIQFSVTPTNQGPVTGFVAVPIIGSGGQGETPGFASGIDFLVCEVPRPGFESRPAPNGSNQTAVGKCILVTLGNGTSTLNFINFQVAPPTAAPVSVSGRVLNSRSRGVFNAFVTLTAPNGEERFTITNPFGYYRFDDVAVGETYVLTVRSKRYTFTPQVISVSEELTGLNFVAEP